MEGFKMPEYHRYNLALNDEEQYLFLKVKEKEKKGVKKIFMAGLESLSPAVDAVISKEEE
jgi:hypothetical protein